MSVSATNTTLSDILWPRETAIPRWLRFALLAAVGSLLLAFSAKIKFYVGPVPITLTTLVVLALSAAYGARLAVATLLLYLAEGALGLPVFAGTPEKGIGIAYMMGPTGGYLLGYVLAAATVGYLAEKGWDRSVFSMAGAMAIGNVLIYVPGLLWLGMLFGWDKPILEWGLYPFIAGDAIKLGLAAVSFPLIWKLMRRV